MTNEITLIKIENLHPNIDNPRQGVGDISELTESIKARGILQPLTLIPGSGSWLGEYVIVLGHRRFAAANAAGLTEIPCIICNMSKAEQIDAMIIENDRRADLTKIERSNGYQLSFDLHNDNYGETAAAVGVSESTVRRYLKLQAIDETTRHKLHERERDGVQITMADYDKLADIRDEGRREKVAETLGTKEFNLTYNKELYAEQSEINFANLLSEIELSGMKKADTSAGLLYLGYASKVDELNNITEDLEDADCELYYVPYNTYVSLYRTYFPEETAARENADEENNLKREREYKLRDLFEAAYHSRLDFMKSLTEVKACVVMAWAAKRIMIAGDGGDDRIVAEVLGIQSDIGEDDFMNLIAPYMVNKPMLLLAAMVYSSFSDYENNTCIDWQLEYSRNIRLEKIYNFLKDLGYEISSEEQALLDGTHELY